MYRAYTHRHDTEHVLQLFRQVYIVVLCFFTILTSCFCRRITFHTTDNFYCLSPCKSHFFLISPSPTSAVVYIYLRCVHPFDSIHLRQDSKKHAIMIEGTYVCVVFPAASYTFTAPGKFVYLLSLFNLNSCLETEAS